MECLLRAGGTVSFFEVGLSCVGHGCFDLFWDNVSHSDKCIL